ncbi:SpoVR family protein [Alicyclobacillus tolerans]|uniref:SpoVR family protein n=1 Tax=Alicyclobacillus tolerans TaxID=90970 RepID=UPI001F343BAE|nr:SpoVR family protein [Alicyclobacillus tolerans]MCF8568486.1 SpoVR family protein [Alicyclobacillus tolerans]
MKAKELERFENTVRWMEDAARGFGLDFFDMRYEFCPPDVVYRIAGAGMPTRFNHWSFGKHYYRQKLDYDFGLSRIYELVINNDPCYAFLLENNTVLQNELIVAHVLGHSDFFKNNARFGPTNRSMVETMAATAHRFDSFEREFGKDVVEQISDAALAIAEHVDPSLIPWQPGALHRGGYSLGGAGYATDLFEGQTPSQGDGPERDLLRFILDNGRHLPEWGRDVLASIREESLYFWPQMETKIMNEGWATYWHVKLMQEMDLSVEDSIEFAKLTANVVQPNRFVLNPYNVGLAIWRDIEKKYGVEQMFIARECDSDISFLRNYLTQDLVDECDLYLYEKQGDNWVIVERDYRVIRDLLVQQRVNAGFPVIYAEDGDYKGTGELLLVHAYEGSELDDKYVQKTLPHVYRLWGRPVSLRTKFSGHDVEYAYDGRKVVRTRI